MGERKKGGIAEGEKTKVGIWEKRSRENKAGERWHDRYVGRGSGLLRLCGDGRPTLSFQKTSGLELGVFLAQKDGFF